MQPSAPTISLAPGLEVIERFGDWRSEYRAARTGIALTDRPHRGLVEIDGNDRSAWLHNLVTNEVKGLCAGEGVYAFAIDVKGRVLFDLNILVCSGRILLDIDRRWLARALEHFERFLITEDVSVAEKSAEFVRIGLLGPEIKPFWADLGMAHLPLMADVHHANIQIGGVDILSFRNDFAGVLGVELIVPSAHREPVRAELIQSGERHTIREAGWRAIQALRIEQGVPWSLEDIDDRVIPPETGRVEQGISYHKGCYLGQEVIERMRSRGAPARRLVGVCIDGNTAPRPGAELFREGKPRGRVTSLCHSPALNATLALAYLTSACAEPGTDVEIAGGDEPIRGKVVSLPLGVSPQ